MSHLVAPPYDVINPELQSRLYARDPHNVVRVDLGLTTPSDNDCDNQYTRAASQLAQWKAAGILVRDSAPTVTFVEECFTGPDGRASVRHGFLAAVRLFEFDEGVVFPHEHTLSGPKEDRYRLMRATGMNLSPVFLLYDLRSDAVTATWRASLSGATPHAVVQGDDGATTRLWPTSHAGLLEVIRYNLGESRLLIADGHHRYETALRYWREHRTEAAEYAIGYFSNMSDPGLAIFATHRLLSGLDPGRVAALPQALAGSFEVTRLIDTEDAARATSASGDAAAAQDAIARYLATHPRQAFGLWAPSLDAAYGFRLVDAQAAGASAPGHSAAYQQLDVTILQTLVLERLLDISAADVEEERFVTFFKEPSDAFARLATGEFQAGFFMNPTGLDQIREVAFGGERMPQKATFFYPKLPTGLVFLDLTGRL